MEIPIIIIVDRTIATLCFRTVSITSLPRANINVEKKRNIGGPAFEYVLSTPCPKQYPIAKTMKPIHHQRQLILSILTLNSNKNEA